MTNTSAAHNTATNTATNTTNTARMPRTKKTPNGYKRMLTTANYKTSKGESLGYFTGILYLSPATESGLINTCSFATIGCANACLGAHAGRNVMTTNKASRLWKTRMLVENRELFLACLRYDVAKLVRRANKLGLIPAVRINGSSDLPWISQQLAREFPDVQFYDYTKLPKPQLRVLPNYHITFSYSGENLPATLDALSHGVNVAVVFNTRKGNPLPESWQGYSVVDGDTHDLRFLDTRGVVIGLRAKGKAMKQNSCFIVNAQPEPLIQISLTA